MLTGALCLFVVGVSLGWLGAGGTAIALPALVYVVGIEAHAAVALSLLLVGGASVFGVVLHARKGLVRWRAALAFTPAGILGALAGSRLSYLLSGRALLLSFSVLLAVFAWRMLSEQGGEAPRRRAWWVTTFAGLGIGVVTGMLGVGGGRDGGGGATGAQDRAGAFETLFCVFVVGAGRVHGVEERGCWMMLSISSTGGAPRRAKATLPSGSMM